MKPAFRILTAMLIAAAWLSIAAPSPAAGRDPAARLQAAKNAYFERDHATALRLLLPLAEAGDATAQYYLGHIYRRGLAVFTDHTEAARWYQKAAEQGMPEAQYNLGIMYLQGSGVPRDLPEALRWLEEAAERGNAEARRQLAQMNAYQPPAPAGNGGNGWLVAYLLILEPLMFYGGCLAWFVAPVLLLRFVYIRRPVSVETAIVTVIAQAGVNIQLMPYMWASPIFWGLQIVSYFIMRKGAGAVRDEGPDREARRPGMTPPQLTEARRRVRQWRAKRGRAQHTAM